ncbi:MAG TPA: S1/P1 Nuclease [Flavobacteriales bacterium]|nr:S1/P1 Nuclease [Flavobacteriales bacterium]|tara:strand:+ start:20351 stop:21355 length:1005 start_codon:yes stop_codon:yes gene_type:complete
MIKKILISFLTLLLLNWILLPRPTALSWGFYGHKKINRLAVFTLPEQILPFYKSHIEFITEHAVDPDKRRYAVEGEAAHHYIDIDHYGDLKKGENPFEIVPKTWKDAVQKFTEDTLLEYGIVPWWIPKVYYRLVKAFEEKNIDKILRYSADIGHYIGDAHVPLHTTENYNGQLTGQKGIHGLWESRLPELFADNYDFWTGKATYRKNILNEAWDAVYGSHMAMDSVLTIERELTEEFPTDKKFTYETRGRVLVKTYSKEFADAYHQRLNGMVERRMRRAIITVGSIWYSAWVKAGMPQLKELENATPSKELLEEEKQLDNAFSSGKIKGREHEE